MWEVHGFTDKTVGHVSLLNRFRSNEKGTGRTADGDVRHGIDKANDPAVLGADAFVGNGAAGRPRGVWDAERRVESQIGAIATSLQSKVSVPQRREYP